MSDHGKNVTFTHQQVSEYATIQLEGQYLLAGHLVNLHLAPHRDNIGLLVDFGSGAGKSTRAVASSVRPGGTIIGVDISSEFVREARALTNQIQPTPDVVYEYRKIVSVKGRETIPVDDGMADAVTTTIVLQEMQTEQQLRNALAEMGRIAKPGALLVAACVSDKIINEDYTTFTYTGFPQNIINANTGNNVRQCASTVSQIVWDRDRHWSAQVLMDGFRRGGWTNVSANYPLATDDIRPFPSRPEVGWRDETRVAPLVLITGVKGNRLLHSRPGG